MARFKLKKNSVITAIFEEAQSDTILHPQLILKLSHIFYEVKFYIFVILIS